MDDDWGYTPILGNLHIVESGLKFLVRLHDFFRDSRKGKPNSQSWFFTGQPHQQ